MKNLMLVLVLLVSGLGYSQKPSKVTQLPTITKKVRDSLKKIAAQPIDLSVVEVELIEMINDYRVENGLHPLERHPLLDSAARFQSTYMCSVDDATHYNPEKGMENSDKRVTKFMGKTSKYIVENSSNRSIYLSLRQNQELVENIFNGWRNSVGHNKVLLYPYTNLIGLSLVRLGDRIYSVMDSAKYE